MVRILLVPPPSIHLNQLQPFVPTGLLSLQVVAQDSGCVADVLSFSSLVASRRSFATSEELAAALAGGIDVDAYDAVGLSTMCSSFHHSLNLARLLKTRRTDLQVWVGGPHVSLAAGRVLNAYPDIDAVFVGETEATLGDVLEASKAAGRFCFDHVKGVVTRNSAFAPRKAIPNLDSLPFLDEADGFLDAFGSSKGIEFPDAVPLEAERGCPGSCGFCSTRLLWKNPPRRKSDARMLEEMHRLSRVTGMRQFSLIGDNFASPYDKLLRFCGTMHEQGPEYEWYCHLKLDRLVQEDLHALWEGGCRGFFVGIESASQRTLDRVHKGVNLQRELEVVYRAIDLGFFVVTSLIIGFPWETRADIDLTYQLHNALLQRGVSRSLVSVLCPLPGTELLQKYGEHVQPFRGLSKTAIDGLPYGSETWDLMRSCPELFTQLGYFDSEASWAEVAATADAAQMLTGYYARKKRNPSYS